MTATLRCSRCGRQPWQDLNVHVTDDGMALCDGPDCDEIALGLSTGIPKRRTSALLALTAMSAVMGGGMSYPRHPTRRDIADAQRRERTLDHHGVARVAAAEAKRARRATKRLRTAEGAAPGDDVDPASGTRAESRSTPHALAQTPGAP